MRLRVVLGLVVALVASQFASVAFAEEVSWGAIKDKYTTQHNRQRITPPRYEPLPQNLPGPEDPGGASYQNYMGGGYATLPIGVDYTAEDIIYHARTMPGVVALVSAYEGDGYVRRPAQDQASNEPYASLAMIVLDGPTGSPAGRQALIFIASYGYVTNNESAGSQIFAIIGQDSSGCLVFKKELSRMAAQVSGGSATLTEVESGMLLGGGGVTLASNQGMMFSGTQPRWNAGSAPAYVVGLGGTVFYTGHSLCYTTNFMAAVGSAAAVGSLNGGGLVGAAAMSVAATIGWFATMNVSAPSKTCW